jgi:hypothetical protein
MQRLSSVRFDWHQLWTALYVVDDVDLAIDTYLTADFPDDSGEQYLRVFGVFQALFVQQDALDHVIAILNPTLPTKVADVLKDIRELRNASVGHPTSLRARCQHISSTVARWTKMDLVSCLSPISMRTRPAMCLFAS